MENRIFIRYNLSTMRFFAVEEPDPEITRVTMIIASDMAAGVAGKSPSPRVPHLKTSTIVAIGLRATSQRSLRQLRQRIDDRREHPERHQIPERVADVGIPRLQHRRPQNQWQSRTTGSRQWPRPRRAVAAQRDAPDAEAVVVEDHRQHQDDEQDREVDEAGCDGGHGQDQPRESRRASPAAGSARRCA